MCSYRFKPSNSPSTAASPPNRKDVRDDGREQTQDSAHSPPHPMSEQEFRGEMTRELETYQIDLDAQKEELRQARETIAAFQARYAELYHSAPVGYFTFDETGVISKVNKTGPSLLGLETNRLKSRPFSVYLRNASKDAFYRHHKNVLSTGTPRSCELLVIRKGDRNPLSVFADEFRDRRRDRLLGIVRKVVKPQTANQTRTRQVISFVESGERGHENCHFYQ